MEIKEEETEKIISLGFLLCKSFNKQKLRWRRQWHVSNVSEEKTHELPTYEPEDAKGDDGAIFLMNFCYDLVFFYSKGILSSPAMSS